MGSQAKENAGKLVRELAAFRHRPNMLSIGGISLFGYSIPSRRDGQ